MIKNLPTNARGHRFDPRAKKMLQAMEEVSSHAMTTEDRAPRAHALQQEKPPQWEACAQSVSRPCSLQLEESPRSNKDPEQLKINKYF